MPGCTRFGSRKLVCRSFRGFPNSSATRVARSDKRLATGVPGLDEMTGGGIPAGDVGPTHGPCRKRKDNVRDPVRGAGIARRRELRRRRVRGVSRNVSCARKDAAARSRRDGRPREARRHLSAAARSLGRRNAGRDPHAVQRLGATRVVIDSLSGFEVALAPSYREDFRESLYRLVGALTATGVTVLMTAEVIDPYPGVSIHVGARLVHHGRHFRATIRRDRRTPREGAGHRQNARQRSCDGFPTVSLTLRGRSSAKPSRATTGSLPASQRSYRWSYRPSRARPRRRTGKGDMAAPPESGSASVLGRLAGALGVRSRCLRGDGWANPRPAVRQCSLPSDAGVR